MSREEFIGKLQMVYVGDRNAFNDIVCAYDSVLSANEKAIEYVNSHLYMESTCGIQHPTFDGKPSYDFDCFNLLDILQNGSDSQ